MGRIEKELAVIEQSPTVVIDLRPISAWTKSRRKDYLRLHDDRDKEFEYSEQNRKLAQSKRELRESGRELWGQLKSGVKNFDKDRAKTELRKEAPQIAAAALLGAVSPVLGAAVVGGQLIEARKAEGWKPKTYREQRQEKADQKNARRRRWASWCSVWDRNRAARERHYHRLGL